MICLILPVILATLLALARGGTLAGWARRRVRWAPAILAAFAVQLLVYSPPLDGLPWVVAWGNWVWVASLIAVAAALLGNGLAGDAPRGAWLAAALGVALNVLVVAANGGQMPRVEPAASGVTPAGVAPPAAAAAPARLTNVAPATAETRLAWLGDVIAQPAWLPLANVVSVGDLLLAGGAAWWAFAATASVRRGRAASPAGAARAAP
jgi:hypothetical protein